MHVCAIYVQYIVYHKYMYYMYICDVCMHVCVCVRVCVCVCVCVRACVCNKLRCVMWLGLREQMLPTHNAPIHTAVTISYSVWAILNVSFIVNSLYGMLYMYDDTCYISYY